MNKNESDTANLDNDIGIAAFMFGITSVFFFAQLFAPLALLFGSVAIFKKQRTWGIAAIVGGLCGFISSPLLFGVLWLAITGTKLDNERVSDTITPQTAITKPSESPSFFNELSDKTVGIVDNISCNLGLIVRNEQKPCSHSVPETPIPVVQNQALLPEFMIFFQTYSSKPNKKALALAHDNDRREAWGFGVNYSTQEQANDRAMTECRSRIAQYHVNADCKLYAIGDVVVWDSGSNR
jgi:hypothetical protein